MPIPSSSRAGELSSSFTVVSDMKDESGGRAGTFMMKNDSKRVTAPTRGLSQSKTWYSVLIPNSIHFVTGVLEKYSFH